MTGWLAILLRSLTTVTIGGIVGGLTGYLNCESKNERKVISIPKKEEAEIGSNKNPIEKTLTNSPTKNEIKNEKETEDVSKPKTRKQSLCPRVTARTGVIYDSYKKCNEDIKELRGGRYGL